MTSPILLTGGTGALGRLVAPLLRDAGRPVRVLSRRSHEPEDGPDCVTGDLTNGEGLDAAVRGVGTILHLAGSSKGDEVKARNLVQAASAAGAQHLVFISVVGADRIPVESSIDRALLGYFAAKGAAERVVSNSGIPWTTLRATQFHELTLKTVQQVAKMPVVPVPAGWQFQPIAAAEVAARLVELSLGAPSGLVPDLAGPRVYSMTELVRSYLQATHHHRLTVPLRLPGRAARAFRAGANLAPERAVGRQTWEDHLGTAVGAG